MLTGADRRQERIEVRVPAGVQDGQVIRVRGKGQDGPGGRGDLMIRCGVRPHPFFRRDGAKLMLDVPLSMTEAALGAKVQVPTWQGPAIVTIPPGTSSGAKLRLRGKGAPAPDGTPGDLVVVVKIVAPQDLSPRARELFEALSTEVKQTPRDELDWTY